MKLEEQIKARIKQEQQAFSPLEESSDELSFEFIVKCMRFNELGDGTLFSILNKNKFVRNTHSGQVMVWDNHSWRADIYSEHLTAVDFVAQQYSDAAIEIFEKMSELSHDQDAKKKKLLKIQDALFKRASRLRSKRGRENCFSLATTLKREETLSVSGDIFDSNPWLLGCKNGVMDLKTGKFREGRPGDYISKASPIEFQGMKVACKKWSKFLNATFDSNKDITSYLQRLFGYCITGLSTEHIFPVWTGRGRNGKGTIAQILYYVLGHLAAPIRSEMLLAQSFTKNSSAPSPDIMALKGLRVAIASETDEKHSFDPAQVKLLTGGDSLSGRNLHDIYQSFFKPTHSLILLTNNQPRCPGDDYAFWQRVHLLHFPFSFINNPKEKNERQKIDDLYEQLMEEGPGILAWMVKGCLLWQKEGLNPPQEVVSATLKYKEEEDIIGTFVKDRCITSPDIKTNATILHEAFKIWYQEKIGARPMSQIRFGKKLVKKFERIKTVGVTYYLGIGLRPLNQKEEKEEEKIPF